MSGDQIELLSSDQIVYNLLSMFIDTLLDRKEEACREKKEL